MVELERVADARRGSGVQVDEDESPDSAAPPLACKPTPHWAIVGKRWHEDSLAAGGGGVWARVRGSTDAS